MRRSLRGSLPLGDSVGDPSPEDLPDGITAFEHQVNTARGMYFGISAELAHQQICGSPDVEI
jgi:hypothetical protein